MTPEVETSCAVEPVPVVEYKVFMDRLKSLHELIGAAKDSFEEELKENRAMKGNSPVADMDGLEGIIAYMYTGKIK